MSGFRVEEGHILTYGAMPQRIVSSGEKLQIVRVPGFYWHGTKTIGDEPSLLVYFVTRLYDYQAPHEERRPWNDPAIIDPATKKPYDWNKQPFKWTQTADYANRQPQSRRLLCSPRTNL